MLRWRWRASVHACSPWTCVHARPCVSRYTEMQGEMQALSALFRCPAPSLSLFSLSPPPPPPPPLPPPPRLPPSPPPPLPPPSPLSLSSSCFFSSLSHLFLVSFSFPLASPSVPFSLSLSLFFPVRFALPSRAARGVWCNELENQYPSTGKYRPRLATARAPPRKSRSLFRERTERAPFPPPDAVGTAGPPQDRLNLAPPLPAWLPPLLPLPLPQQRALRSFQFLPFSPSFSFLPPLSARYCHSFALDGIDDSFPRIFTPLSTFFFMTHPRLGSLADTKILILR